MPGEAKQGREKAKQKQRVLKAQATRRHARVAQPHQSVSQRAGGRLGVLRKQAQDRKKQRLYAGIWRAVALGLAAARSSMELTVRGTPEGGGEKARTAMNVPSRLSTCKEREEQGRGSV